MSSKNVLYSMFLSTIITSSIYAGDAPHNGDLTITTQTEEDSKPKMSIKAGDAELTLGGEVKMEYYFNKNIEFLNDNIPDQCEYFKQNFDLNTHFKWGEKTYGRPAVEAMVKIRNKTVWGLGAVFADSDATQPTKITLSETNYGSHSHINGKPLIWMNQAWLKLYLNALIGCNLSTDHTIQFGFFPFELGRGIALGSLYGVNRQLLGLYSYPEDKSAPGILLHGDIVKDRLTYDVYYSKFEERDKSCRYTLDLVKGQLINNRKLPYRGTGKDNELIAGQLTWLPLKKNGKHGKLELRPYAFYNEASDQMVEIPFDAKTELGSAGLYSEYAYKKFEIGGEVAFNFGQERVRAMDRNVLSLQRYNNPDADGCTSINQNNEGNIQEVYTHILDRTNLDTKGNPRNAVVTACSKNAAKIPVVCDTDELVIFDKNGNPVLVGDQNRFVSKSGRIRPCYTNKFRGWMGVIDAAYTFEKVNLKLAAAYGYASGDKNPHKDEVDKNYRDFIGLHEGYSGKRVKSLIVLDERLIKIPGTLNPGDTTIEEDFAFTDLQHVGASATWKPAYFKSKNLTINPNVICFWTTFPSKVFDEINLVATNQDASKFMGTELYLNVQIEPLKDLTFTGDFSVFVPGQFFSDVSGIPLGKDFFSRVEKLTDTTGLEARRFRLNDNTGFYLRLGARYRF